MAVTPTPPLAGRHAQILEAAEDHFRRYGFARTSMGDVAKAAKVSRASLYLAFPGKDDLFAVVIDRMAGRAFQRIRDETEALETFAEKLAVACDVWGAQGFELVERHPDAKDLFDPDREPVQRMYADFERLLVELMVGTSLPPRTQARLARLVSWSLRGYKDMARDGAEFREMLPTLVKSIADQVVPQPG